MLYTIPFKKLTKNNIPIAGGKGANLGEMTTAGFPIPAGFVLTTEAYNAFVETHELQQEIINLASKVSTDKPQSSQKASDAIKKLFLGATIPKAIQADLQKAYTTLGNTPNPAVAVRSSATAEDLPTASFAGQQDTFLNVQGQQALLEAVKKCWASLWTARAIIYRIKQNIDPASVSLAVVIQQLIPADKAGILFTANPLNGQRDQLLINATWGLGEAIVSGQVTPDTIVVDKPQWQILSQEITTKTVMTMRTNEGTEEQPIPQTQQNQAVLDDATAIELARLGAKIETHYAMPMDIEWAITHNKIAILQARPITSLPEPQLDPPTEWPVPKQNALYARSSIVEQLPNPLSPLFATLGRPAIVESLDGIMKLFLNVDKKAKDWIDFPTINGYGYYEYDMNVMYKVLFGSISGLLNFIKLIPPLLDGTIVEEYWRNEYHPRYVNLVNHWQAKSITNLSATDLLTAITDLLHEGCRYYTSVQMVIPPTMTSEMILTAFYDKLIKRKNDPQITPFMLGFDSLPINAEKSLYDLAIWTRQHKTLSTAILNTPSAQLTTLFQNAHPLADPNPPQWTEWQTRFQTHLDQFGHMIYDMDFMSAIPSDHPTPLIETLKFYLQGKSVNPHTRQQESIANREQLIQTTLNRLDPIRERIFTKLLNWAHQFAPLREDALADIGLAWPLMRQMLAELGHRLQTVAVIENPNDIYWLEADELRQAVTQLDAGQTDIENFADRIKHRQALMKAQQRVTPPPSLPKKARILGLDFEKWSPAKHEESQTGPRIAGTGASPGQVTATAKVLSGPQDFSQMQAGDILVASITTPAWTPLFALASAVVTDVGGVLSHSSIVAREYGIPAVLGTGVATNRIKSGQQIQVDGNTGTVTLLDEIDPTAIEKAPVTEAMSSTKKFALVALVVGLVLALVMWYKKRK